MAKFSKFVPLTALAALVATTAPALAAPYGQQQDSRHHQSAGYGYQHAGYSNAMQFRRDIAKLDQRIDRALARRDISAREAMALRQDVRELSRMHDRFARGGFTRQEVRVLDTRLAQVTQSFRFERRDDDRRRG